MKFLCHLKRSRSFLRTMILSLSTNLPPSQSTPVGGIVTTLWSLFSPRNTAWKTSGLFIGNIIPWVGRLHWWNAVDSVILALSDRLINILKDLIYWICWYIFNLYFKCHMMVCIYLLIWKKFCPSVLLECVARIRARDCVKTSCNCHANECQYRGENIIIILSAS